MNRFIEVDIKRTLILLFLLKIFSLGMTKNVCAQVVINEVFANPSGSRQEPNEFIELMNLSQEAVSLDGYKLLDAISKEYVIEDINLGSEEFISFRREVTRIALNNSGTEEVILINNSGEEIDRFVYDETIEDRSWSRIPDGSGNFYNGTIPSEGEANNPAPTSTPEPTPKPTSTPKPTKTPKLTSTTRPTTPSDRSGESDDEVLGQSTDMNKQIEFEEEESLTSSDEATINNNISDFIVKRTQEDEDHKRDPQTLENKKNSPLGAGFFILGGLGFIGAAGYPIIRKNGILNVIKKEKD